MPYDVQLTVGSVEAVGQSLAALPGDPVGVTDTAGVTVAAARGLGDAVAGADGVTADLAGTPYFADGFESGDFAAKWDSCQWNAGGTIRNDNCNSYDGTSQYSATVVSESAEHPHAARFELRNGDVPFGSTERAEIARPPGTDQVEGEQLVMEWDMKFAADFAVPAGWWCIPWQWHGSSDTVGSPPLCLDIDQSRDIYLANNNAAPDLQRTLIGPLVRGVWQHWKVEAFWSPTTSGWAELSIDGSVVLAQHSRKTMIAGQATNYFKCGLYRDPVNTSTMILWHDNIEWYRP